ncbi:chain-length determining protein [uncultured Bacteroides sp.]|uniref:chain-length determining protein n=1 Tax=uncultured Bacteroides sp. TaxID=162156 RepID=UPI00262A7458|nr:chain-length determining protein [uncultured Bacteroides sp.]
MEENKNYTKPEKKVDDNQDEESSIDWMEILQKIIVIRKTLYKVAGVGLLIGVIVAFSLPRQYTVTVTLSPEMNADAQANVGIASLASSFLGGALGTTSDALNASLSTDIVASTPFLLELFDTRVQTLDGETDTTLVAYLDELSTPWWNKILAIPRKTIKFVKNILKEKNDSIHVLDPFQLTEDEFAKVQTLQQLIVVEIDKKTAITNITVTMQDPKVTAMLADTVINKLQKYIINYRISKAKEDCAYLENLYNSRKQEYYEAQEKYAQYVDANKNVILLSVRAEQDRLQNEMNVAYQIYLQIAQQLQIARAKIQEQKPVFAVVEPASIPLFPSNMSRKFIVVGYIMFSVLGAISWILYGRDYWKRIKMKYKK